MSEALPWWARAVLVDAAAVERALDRIRESGLVPAVPNTWQVTLGVLRMWHRLLFRSGEIGTSSRPVRPTWRARLLAPRPLRFPFLLAEKAVAPHDFSGLLSSRERVIRHLLGAHHDGVQFAYDLEMLRVHPGALEELLGRARDVVDGDGPRARWLRDLCVFEGYHEALVALTERALEGDLGLAHDQRTDPDISFYGYLAWCAGQPPTYEATIAAARAGRYAIASGLVAQEPT